MDQKRFVECIPHQKNPSIRTNKEQIHQQEMESDKPFTNDRQAIYERLIFAKKGKRMAQNCKIQEIHVQEYA